MGIALPVIADSDGDDGRAQRGPARHLEAPDRSLGLGVAAYGPVGDECALLEGDDADADAARLGRDERPRRSLRGRQPVWGNVLGAHAVGHVHGEDDGAGRAGHRERCRRPGYSDREHRDARDRQPHPGLRGAARPGDAGRGQRRGPTAGDGDGAAAQGHGDEQADGEQRGRGECHARRAMSSVDDLDERVGEVIIGADAVQGHPGPAHAGVDTGVALASARPEARPQQRVAGVDDELLPVSASSTTIRPASGSSSSAVSMTRRAATSWRGVSRSKERSQSPAPMKSETATMRLRRRASRATASSMAARSVVRPRWASAVRASSAPMRRTCQAARTGRHHAHHPGVVEQRPDAVPAPAEQAGQDEGQLGEHVMFPAAGRAHRHRRRAVEHQPRGQLAVLVEHAQVRVAQPGGDVPVDVPRIVALDVVAQAGQIGTGPAVRGAVAALDPSLQTADNPPFQAEQESFGDGAHGLTGPAGRRQARARRSAPGRRCCPR